MLDAPPLPDALCHDPVLSRVKLIAAPTNDALLPRNGTRGFPHWGLWQQRNAAFRRDITAVLAEGTRGMLDSVALRLTGSADLFEAMWEEGLPGNLGAPRRPAFSFNAATATGGPSLHALAKEVAGVAGAALVASGAVGAQFPSSTTIAKTLLLAVIVAQGVPVISEADVADVELARFVGVAMRLRRQLAHLLLPPLFDSPRDIAWVSASGGEPDWAATATDGAAYDASYFAFVVRHPDGSAVYVGFNPHPHAVSAVLPPPPPGHVWLRAVDTALPPPDDASLEGFVEAADGTYGLGGKAGVVLVAGIVEHR